MDARFSLQLTADTGARRASRARAVRMALFITLTAALATLSTATTAEAQRLMLQPEPNSVSCSQGFPWDGELRNGVRLHESETLRHVNQYEPGGNFYGTEELVGLLERAGVSLAEQFPGTRLSVGELSAKDGGWIDGHRSHRNGRDADIAFFMRSPDGKYAPYWRFVAFERHGPADAEDAGLGFDDERNWAMVSQLLRDPATRIQYIFVSNPVRARLLIEGRRVGESEDFLRAAAAVMVEPQRGHKHENHFHVRIFCPRDDRPHCQDSSPYWPWFEGESPEGFYTELPKIRWRNTRSGRTPSAPTVLQTAPSPTALGPDDGDAPATASSPAAPARAGQVAHTDVPPSAGAPNPG